MLNTTPGKAPSQSIIDVETEHLLLCFCTYCTLLKGKKLSLQNVFVLILKDERLRQILKDMISVDNNFELDTLSNAKDFGKAATAQFYPIDINGISRLNDLGPDVGAYERLE